MEDKINIGDLFVWNGVGWRTERASIVIVVKILEKGNLLIRYIDNSTKYKWRIEAISTYWKHIKHHEK